MLQSPAVPAAAAARFLADHFGLQGRLRPLGSHQDQNFLVETADGRYVLKIANPVFTRGELEAQNAAMRHLGQAGVPFGVPIPQPVRDGALIATVTHEGRPYHLRLVTFLDGAPLEEFGYLAPSVVSAVGAVAAQVAGALRDFTHPGTERVLQWDCRHAAQVVAALAPSVANPRWRALAEQVMATAAVELAPLAAALRVQVVHADITTVNLVACRDRAGRPELCGLIDFGDLSRTWLVSELAVPIVSLVPHDPGHPVQLAREALRGFHAVLPLSEEEIAALWPLVLARAALSAVSGEQQAALEPNNSYVHAGLEAEWQALERVAAIPSALAHAAFRAALGLGPSAPMAAAQGSGAAVVDLPAGRPVEALDLTVQSPDLVEGAWAEPTAVQALVARVAARAVPVGRYGERRLVYTRPDAAEEPAAVHLGVDVFLAPGTSVQAPVAAVVAAVDPQTLVLRSADYDLRLAGITPAVALGEAVAAGAAVGTLAAPTAGALLPAHVHVQVVAVPGLAAPGLAVASLAEAWQTVCPDPSALLGFPAAAAVSRPDALLERRANALARVQQHYYAAPPQIERGWRHYLYDTDGRAYLDMINNVAILGHSHPGVAAAVVCQLRLLNTNSRFHYDLMVRFAERLAALLPAPLDTVFLVSTGSEANDLALRLIRIATGQKDVLSVRSAYHGWTTATDEVSTSLVDHPGAAETRPPWVHAVLSPNTYRGPFRGPDAAERYADDVRATLARIKGQGRGVAGFIAEALYGNAGGLVLPDGYLQAVYALVREAGGLCIADEVQVGYGRLGTVFWGFEQQGVVPDVVTIAKASGNGYPVGAVMTTRAIADSFAREGSFFSSVGGSPASSAAGLAVLDALVAEGLQANARTVGAHLKAGLQRLVERHPLCGAVHGLGLYLGLELVRDRATQEPATDETAAICERMRERGIIVQPTSDHMNVLKIKPPLCITRASADFFVETLDQVLTQGW